MLDYVRRTYKLANLIAIIHIADNAKKSLGLIKQDSTIEYMRPVSTGSAARTSYLARLDTIILCVDNLGVIMVAF